MNQKNTPQSGEVLLRLHNAEAEAAVIGSIVMESTAFEKVCESLRPQHFYSNDYALIYRAAQLLYDKGVKIDSVSLARELRKDGEVNGIEYMLVKLSVVVSSSANISYHAALIKECFLRRELQKLSAKAAELSNDFNEDILDSLEKIGAEADLIANSSFVQNENKSIKDTAYSAYTEYFEREKAYAAGKPFGVNTGLNQLNASISGWQPANLVILAARPAMGKTSLMLHMAKEAAKNSQPAVIFSLEMSAKELSNKLILSECEASANRFRNGTLTIDEKTAIGTATEAIYSLPITINDKADISVRQIKTIAKNLKKQGKCDVVFIDYLQLLNMKTENKAYNREQEVSQASRSLKLMAKELDVPVIVLSQLSRNCEDRPDKMPRLSDLRESGAIEQDADIVAFIFRPEYYGIQNYGDNSTNGLIILNIAKARNNPTGEIEFRYNEQMTKFQEKTDNKPF